MGGICGIVERDGQVNEELLRRMRDTMVHRGPDSAGIYLSRDRKAGFGHRSLDLTDNPADGHEPACNEDETIWVTCDGEIYNLPELKRSLEAKGHRFKSCCDAEVIAHLYEETGCDFASRLDGRFAVALWDSSENTLSLARDRLGEKPLYFLYDRKRLLFASELKAILADSSVPREIDPAALHDYLILQYVPGPGTIFEGIEKLPPSHILKFANGRKDIRAYWRLTPKYAGINRGDIFYEEELSALIRDTVKKRLAGGVPTGIHLNGGISSSAIIAMMDGSLQGNLKSFTFGCVGEGDTGFQYNSMIADMFGCDHKNITLEPVSASDIIPRLAGQFDEPLAHQGAAAAYLMSKLIREDVKICFSDEGSDEILGGCQRHEIALKRKGIAETLVLGNADIESDIRDGLAPSLDDYVKSQSSFHEGEMGRLLHPDVMSNVLARGRETFPNYKAQYDSYKDLDYLSRLQGLDIRTYIADNLNVKADRMSMLASLELRNPVLDYRLAEFAISLPQHHKVRAGIYKYILRKLMSKHLPGRVVWNREGKQPLSFNKMFNGDLEDYARGLLLSSECGYFKQGYLHGLLSQGWRESPEKALKVWSLIMFEQWRRMYNA